MLEGTTSSSFTIRTRVDIEALVAYVLMDPRYKVLTWKETEWPSGASVLFFSIDECKIRIVDRRWGWGSGFHGRVHLQIQRGFLV